MYTIWIINQQTYEEACIAETNNVWSAFSMLDETRDRIPDRAVDNVLVEVRTPAGIVLY